jgi:hypothetical protein
MVPLRLRFISKEKKIERWTISPKERNNVPFLVEIVHQ